MSVSIVQFTAGCSSGTQFSGEFQRLGRVGSKVSERPKKLFGCSCMNWHHFPLNDCIWRIPGSRNFNIKSRNSSLVLAIGKENVSEDADDMYDDLFNKFGKIVFKRTDQKPLSAEVDDDAESLSFAVAMAKVASDVKAADIRVLFVKPLVYWTRFFIIVTAFSRPQIDAIASRIRDLAEEKYGKVPTGDTKPNSWTLLDFGNHWLYGCQVMLSSTYFFLNKERSTTWKNFTAMRHSLSYLLKNNHHFAVERVLIAKSKASPKDTMTDGC